MSQSSQESEEIPRDIVRMAQVGLYQTRYIGSYREGQPDEKKYYYFTQFRVC